MTISTLQDLVSTIERLTGIDEDEHVVTEGVQSALEELLASDWQVPEAFCQPRPDRYIMYPLHVATDKSFSIAAAVWGVGQGTPVHGHETWGVVGIYRGSEREMRYEKPMQPDEPLRSAGTRDWQPREVTVCCTTDDDVHQVSCAGEVPCVGIHVYGADIGTLRRRSYEPQTGAVSWFVSSWPDDRSSVD